MEEENGRFDRDSKAGKYSPTKEMLGCLSKSLLEEKYDRPQAVFDACTKYLVACMTLKNKEDKIMRNSRMGGWTFSPQNSSQDYPRYHFLKNYKKRY